MIRFIKKQSVHSCGWCGRLLTENDDSLRDEQWEFLRKVINKYGEDVFKKITGKCCENKEKEFKKTSK